MPVSSAKVRISVDSRDYAYAYTLRTAKDFPDDFPVNLPREEFERGVFLPMDQPGAGAPWQTPPRILLLQEGRLFIADHPTEGVAVQCLPLRDIVMLEFGRFLLRSWVRIFHRKGTCFLPHHTRDLAAGAEFWNELKSVLLPPRTEPSTERSRIFGHDFDPKLRYAERITFENRQQPRLRFFSGTALRRTRHWYGTTEESLPSNYLGVTPDTLVWVSDRVRKQRDPYGTVARYASLTELRETRFTDFGSTAQLKFAFLCAPAWNVQVPGEHAELAKEFLDAFLSGELWLVQAHERRNS